MKAATPLGVDARTVAALVATSLRNFYRLQAEPDAPPPLAKGRYDQIAFSRWLIRRNAAELERRGGASDLPEMNAAKLSLMAGQAQRVQLHNAVKRGQLVPMQTVTNLLAMRLVNTRQRLRAIPSSLGPQLTHKTDPAYIEARIMGEINSALAELEGSPIGCPQTPRDGRRRRIL